MPKMLEEARYQAHSRIGCYRSQSSGRAVAGCTKTASSSGTAASADGAETERAAAAEEQHPDTGVATAHP
jgi:hypothetical protein